MQIHICSRSYIQLPRMVETFDGEAVVLTVFQIRKLKVRAIAIEAFATDNLYRQLRKGMIIDEMSLVEFAGLLIIKAEGIEILDIIAEHEVLTSNGRLVLIVPLVGICYACAIIAFANRPRNQQAIFSCSEIYLFVGSCNIHRSNLHRFLARGVCLFRYRFGDSMRHKRIGLRSV